MNVNSDWLNYFLSSDQRKGNFLHRLPDVYVNTLILKLGAVFLTSLFQIKSYVLEIQNQHNKKCVIGLQYFLTPLYCCNWNVTYNSHVLCCRPCHKVASKQSWKWSKPVKQTRRWQKESVETWGETPVSLREFRDLLMVMYGDASGGFRRI